MVSAALSRAATPAVRVLCVEKEVGFRLHAYGKRIGLLVKREESVCFLLLACLEVIGKFFAYGDEDERL